MFSVFETYCGVTLKIPTFNSLFQLLDCCSREAFMIPTFSTFTISITESFILDAGVVRGHRLVKSWVQIDLRMIVVESPHARRTTPMKNMPPKSSSSIRNATP